MIHKAIHFRNHENLCIAAYVSLIFFIAQIEHPLHGNTTMKPLGILTTLSSLLLFLDTWTSEARMLTDERDRSNNGKNIFQQRRVVL